MSKDDKYGLAGIALCGVLAWFDEWWRPFWVSGAVLFGVWTAFSLMNHKTRDHQK